MAALGPVLTGMIIGLSVAAPVGPIGILCIQRTLGRGWGSGLASGLGAASADATYGAVAAFGLTVVSAPLVSEKGWIKLIGGAFLVLLGLRTALAKRVPPERPAALSSPGARASDYASTFALTLANPMTIVFFTAVFTALGLAGTGGGGGGEQGGGALASSAALVLGLFLGSSLWWVVLCSAASAFRARLDPGRLLWLDRLSGAVIVSFGAFALASSAVLLPP